MRLKQWKVIVNAPPGGISMWSQAVLTETVCASHPLTNGTGKTMTSEP